MGFYVDGLGLSTTNKDKVEALAKLKMPSTLDDLEIYLGITGFLRRFVPFYKQKGKPLEDRKTSILKQRHSVTLWRRSFDPTIADRRFRHKED